MILTPPIDRSGGIGRLVSYEMPYWAGDPDVDVKVIDSRGYGSAVRSFPVAAKAAAKLLLFRISRKVDLVHINLSTKASTVRKLFLLCVARLIGIRTVVHLHGSGYDDFFQHLPRPLKFLIRRILSQSDALLVLGKVWADFAICELHLEETQVIVLTNATPGPPITTAPRKTTTLRLLFAGRVGERKGVYDLLVALSLLKRMGRHVRLDIAGDGDLAELRSRAMELGIADMISIHGWVSSEMIGQLFDETDVLVLPSSAENQPLSVIEAMAHARPCICTDVGATSEVVEDGVTGILIEPGNVTSLVSALEEIANDDIRMAMGLAARKVWEEKLTIKAHCEALKMHWLNAARAGGA